MRTPGTNLPPLARVIRPARRPADERSGERGQALALFAGSLVAVLVGVGFVLDTGFAFVGRRDAQNAADLGALAGTHVISEFHLTGSGDGSDVHAAIDEAVRENGCTTDGPDGCTWSADYIVPTTGFSMTSVGSVGAAGAIPPSAQGVEVHISRRPLTFFLGIIGQDDWDVVADATAATARMGNVAEGILLPIAFDPGRTPLVPGRRYLFSEGKDGPGNFSWLSWYDIDSAVELEDNVCHPRNPAYSFPVYVPGGPGKMNKSGVRACLDGYVGQTVYVPLYGDGGAGCPDGPMRGNGSHFEYCLVGVAAFHFEGYHANPAIDDLWGTLVGITSTTSIPADWSGPPCVHGSPGCTSATNYLGLVS